MTNGSSKRVLRLWMANARRSLPVPLSPWIKTGKSVRATFWDSSKSCIMGLVVAIMPWKRVSRVKHLYSATWRSSFER